MLAECFAIHPVVRTEILARLLAFNHRRYAEEVAADPHDNGKGEKRPALPKAQKEKATVGCLRSE